jgi:hypothetical protein
MLFVLVLVLVLVLLLLLLLLLYPRRAKKTTTLPRTIAYHR